MVFDVHIDEDKIQKQLDEHAQKVACGILGEWDFKQLLTNKVRTKMKELVVPMIEEELKDVDVLRAEIRGRIAKSLTAQVTKMINELEVSDGR